MRVVPVLMAASLALVGAASCTGEGETTEIPNPAAVFCEEQGGRVSGPEPLCTLPDGRVVDAWDYYRKNN